MRLSRPLLAELRSRPNSSHKGTRPSPQSYEYKHPWLRALKRTQLTDIAQATGIRSAGTKDTLSERVDRELHSWDYPCGTVKNGRDGPPTGFRSASSSEDGKGEMSILSIDMGIKNLAYSHLIVPGRNPLSGLAEEEEQGHGDGDGSSSSDPLPVLNAWRRIDVSRMSGDPFLPTSSAAAAATTTTTEGKTIKNDSSRPLTFLNQISSSPFITSPSLPKKEQEQQQQEEEEEDSSLIQDDEFWPLALAPRAHTLVSALLDAYKPTHVLLERQRFRTNRAASVFEWTLRVGVFEGMLYATFLALARERGGKAPLVVPVEPARVVRYVVAQTNRSSSEEGEESSSTGEEIKEGKDNNNKKKPTSRETKKIKIDLVAEWLSSAIRPTDHHHHPVNNSQPKLAIGSDELLHRWIAVYLGKRPGLSDKGTSRRSRPKKNEEGMGEDVILREVRKLDDLADCLVQGVTWLEWMRNRECVVREGAKMVGLDRKGKGGGGGDRRVTDL